MTESAISTTVARHDPAHQDRVRELIGSNDDLTSYFGIIVPQPHLETLPEKLTRKCCTYKSCGNTELVLSKSFLSVPVNPDVRGQFTGYLSLQSMRFAYRRASNEDGFFSGNRTQALAFANDPYYFPIDEDADDIRRAEMRR